MNPLLQAALSSVLRWLLAFAAGWFVQHGVWTSSNAETYVAAGATALVSIGWTLWKTYHNRLKFLLALSAPTGTTEAQIKQQIADTSLTDKLVTASAAKVA